MLKFLTGFAALGMLVAVSATTPADARPVTAPGAKAQGEITDFSSQYYYPRRYYRRYAPYPYYGYYRPYRPYYRPYYRPAPFPFFPFSPYYW